MTAQRTARARADRNQKMGSERSPEDEDVQSFENLATPERDHQEDFTRVLPPTRIKPEDKSGEASSDGEEEL